MRGIKNRWLIALLLCLGRLAAFGQDCKCAKNIDTIMMKSLQAILVDPKYPIYVENQNLPSGLISETVEKSDWVKSRIKKFLTHSEKNGLKNILECIEKDTVAFIWRFNAKDFQTVTRRREAAMNDSVRGLNERAMSTNDSDIVSISPMRRINFYSCTKPYFINKELFVFWFGISAQYKDATDYIYIMKYDNDVITKVDSFMVGMQ